MNPPNHPNQQNAENEASYLTRREVIRRRLNSVRRLSTFYRDGYWNLMGELRNEHRQYGLSPFQEQEQEPADVLVDCAFQGCQSKAMPLTPFCFNHILSDPRQVLYKPCEFVITSSQAAGPITCRKPILSSMVPAYCDVHMQLSQMHLTRALQGQGLNISSASEVKPQLHLLIPELVRQIQAKRRKARNEKECKSVAKKEDDIAES